jgi:hypothetical protein
MTKNDFFPELFLLISYLSTFTLVCKVFSIYFLLVNKLKDPNLKKIITDPDPG